MSVGMLGTATINSTKTVVRTVTQAETDKRLEYKVAGENGLMHRVEFFDLEPANLEPGSGDSEGSISEVEATRVTKGTDLVYPSLRKNYLWLIILAPVAWPFVLMNLVWMRSIALGMFWTTEANWAASKRS